MGMSRDFEAAFIANGATYVRPGHHFLNRKNYVIKRYLTTLLTYWPEDGEEVEVQR